MVQVALYSTRPSLTQLPQLKGPPRLQLDVSCNQEVSMRTVAFSPEVLDAIRHDRYHHPHPRIQQRMEVLWLKSKGFTHEDIADLADVSRRTVQRYLDDYLLGGLERLRCLPWRGPAGALDAHQAGLEDYFLENPPRSTREAQAVIEQRTGVRRGLTQVRAFLKKLSACAGARSEPSRPRPTPRSKRTSFAPSSAPA
jgi:transposase